MQARQGMASSDFNGVTILLPQGSGLTETVEQINGAWQKDCSLFFSVEEVPQEEFDARLASGKYTIALAPIRAEGGSVYQMLQQFAGDNNLTVSPTRSMPGPCLKASSAPAPHAANCCVNVNASCWRAAPWCR